MIVPTVLGWSVAQCRKGCKCVVDLTTKATCGEPCCLEADHGPGWKHCCAKHLEQAAGMAGAEFASWRAVRRVFRVGRACHRAARTTSRFWHRWCVVRLVSAVIVGVIVYFSGALGPFGGDSGDDWMGPSFDYEPDQSRRRGPSYDVDSSRELFNMMHDGLYRLPQGYHKRAYVHVGTMTVLTTFDSGSFRNAVTQSFCGLWSRSRRPVS